MAHFEYKVVPAPTKGDKVRGVKQPEARFAHSVEAVLNRMAEGGWEFVRAEMLPNEERSGLSKTTKEWRNLLIFRRERVAPAGMKRDGIDTAEPAVTPEKTAGAGPVASPVAAPAAQAAPVPGAPLVAHEEDHLPEPGFAEAPAAYRAGPEDVAPTEDRDDTAETDDETGEKAPIPLRPLRGWRDRS